MLEAGEDQEVLDGPEQACGLVIHVGRELAAHRREEVLVPGEDRAARVDGRDRRSQFVRQHAQQRLVLRRAGTLGRLGRSLGNVGLRHAPRVGHRWSPRCRGSMGLSCERVARRIGPRVGTRRQPSPSSSIKGQGDDDRGAGSRPVGKEHERAVVRRDDATAGIEPEAQPGDALRSSAVGTHEAVEHGPGFVGGQTHALVADRELADPIGGTVGRGSRHDRRRASTSGRC